MNIGPYIFSFSLQISFLKSECLMYCCTTVCYNNDNAIIAHCLLIMSFLGGVPVGSPTSTGDFVCGVTKKESYRVEYSILQTSTEARMAPGVE